MYAQIKPKSATGDGSGRGLTKTQARILRDFSERVAEHPFRPTFSAPKRLLKPSIPPQQHL